MQTSSSLIGNIVETDSGGGIMVDGYISLSRTKLGPEADPIPQAEHGVRYVERDGNRYKATCRCGWTKRRKSATVAREALIVHIEAASAVLDVSVKVG